MEAPTRQTEVAKPTQRAKRKNRSKLILSLSATVLSIIAIVVSFFTYLGQESANRIADDANKVAREALDVARTAEERERLAREKVEVLKVAWYVGEDDTGNKSVIIVNRNSEAIYDVELTFDEGGQKPTYVSVAEDLPGCYYSDVPLKGDGLALPEEPINLHFRDTQAIRWIIDKDHKRIKEPSRLDPSKFSDMTDTMSDYIAYEEQPNCLAFDR
jgi:hypothetical protein